MSIIRYESLFLDSTKKEKKSPPWRIYVDFYQINQRLEVHTSKKGFQLKCVLISRNCGPVISAQFRAIPCNTRTVARYSDCKPYFQVVSSKLQVAAPIYWRDSRFLMKHRVSESILSKKRFLSFTNIIFSSLKEFRTFVC